MSTPRTRALVPVVFSVLLLAAPAALAKPGGSKAKAHSDTLQVDAGITISADILEDVFD